MKLKHYIYQEAINRWNNHQVNMIQEETGELLIEIGKMLKRINKLKRNTETGVLTSKELIQDSEFFEICHAIGDELADFMIMLDQHCQGFQNYVENKIESKLERLEKRLFT